MMLRRRIGLYIYYVIAKIKYWKSVRFNGFTIIYAFKGSKIDFKGKGIVINSDPYSNLMGLYQRTIIVARHGGKIRICGGTGISGSTIYAMTSIHIGSHCMIGGNCKIIDNDFHSLNAADRKLQPSNTIGKKAISIGDNCFIGANSIILKGTKLGNNCVVGAGSVVSGVFPDNVVIAGNPCKVIRRNKKDE